MALVNKFKKENSAVLLADGFEIGVQSGSLTYQELSGLFSRLMTTIRGHRTGWTSQNGEKGNNDYIPACGEEKLKAALEESKFWRSPRKTEGGRKVGGTGVDLVDIKDDDEEEWYTPDEDEGEYGGEDDDDDHDDVFHPSITGSYEDKGREAPEEHTSAPTAVNSSNISAPTAVSSNDISAPTAVCSSGAH